jgi:hypothetical protein
MLIDWFLELFDKPLDNHLPDEYENLCVKKSLNELNESTNENDSYEEMQSHDLLVCDSNSDFTSCGVRYINGKLMYRCKTMLPAKISFLANDVLNCDEKVAPKDLASTLCVHEIRKHVKFSDDEKLITKKKKGSRKWKPCDAQTYHAHAVRLNPIQAHKDEKLSDVEHLLEQNAQNLSNCTSSSSESPRKIKSVRKNGNSPKKVAQVNAALKSPSSSSSDVSINNLSSPSPSKAVQTAKKLRSLVDDDENDEMDAKKIKTKDSIPDDSKMDVDEEKPSTTTPTTTPTATAATEAVEEADEADEEPKAVNVWTRDEDKIILVMLGENKNGELSKEEMIEKLITKLDKHEKSEICERIEFLMNIVTRLTSN